MWYEYAFFNGILLAAVFMLFMTYKVGKKLEWSGVHLFGYFSWAWPIAIGFSGTVTLLDRGTLHLSTNDTFMQGLAAFIALCAIAGMIARQILKRRVRRCPIPR